MTMTGEEILQIPDAMREYIASLDKPARRTYATRYANWLLLSEEERKTVPEPAPWYVSCDGAMMVREKLHTIQGSEVRHPERGGFKLYDDSCEIRSWFQTLEEAQAAQAEEARHGRVFQIASLTDEQQLYYNYWWPFLFV
jgi:hypothetical protein